MKTTAHLKTTGGSQVSKSESKPKGNILKSVFLTPNGEPSADTSFLPRHWSFLLIQIISSEICRLSNLGRTHTLAVSLRGFRFLSPKLSLSWLFDFRLCNKGKGIPSPRRLITGRCWRFLLGGRRFFLMYLRRHLALMVRTGVATNNLLLDV